MVGIEELLRGRREGRKKKKKKKKWERRYNNNIKSDNKFKKIKIK